MRKLLMGAVSATALLIAGAAFAAGNSSTIDQVGTSEGASVDQTNSSSDAVAQITQGAGGNSSTDANNSASVVQGGSGNQATVTQTQGSYAIASPVSNSSSSDQEGAGDSLTVVQVGDNASNIQQVVGSIDEHALVGQSNYYNSSSIWQSGAYELGVVNQEFGAYNQASIIQSGIGNPSGPFTGQSYPQTKPTGPAGTNLYWDENVPGSPETSVLPGAASNDTEYGPYGAVVDQIGWNNYGAINQAGYQNFADVSQEYDGAGGNNIGAITQGAGVYYSDAVTYQYGQYNIVGINQQGSGTSMSAVWQQGTSNQAYSSQVGSEQSVIGQGVTGGYFDSDDFNHPQVSGDYASVSQVGGGDLSKVYQTGDNNSATVSQGGASDTSSVDQSNTSDVASVTQNGSSDNSTVEQPGTNDQATVYQTAANANSTITQTGTGDFAYVYQQVAANSNSVVTQGGVANVAVVHQ